MRHSGHPSRMNVASTARGWMVQLAHTVFSPRIGGRGAVHPRGMPFGLDAAHSRTNMAGFPYHPVGEPLARGRPSPSEMRLTRSPYDQFTRIRFTRRTAM